MHLHYVTVRSKFVLNLFQNRMSSSWACTLKFGDVLFVLDQESNSLRIGNTGILLHPTTNYFDDCSRKRSSSSSETWHGVRGVHWANVASWSFYLRLSRSILGRKKATTSLDAKEWSDWCHAEQLSENVALF